MKRWDSRGLKQDGSAAIGGDMSIVFLLRRNGG